MRPGRIGVQRGPGAAPIRAQALRGHRAMTPDRTGGRALAEVPAWIRGLDSEDLEFVRLFLLSSGSLKKAASLYGVTYPTIRLRLDRLIQKIRLSEEREEDSFTRLVCRLAKDGRLGAEEAGLLLQEYGRGRETRADPE